MIFAGLICRTWCQYKSCRYRANLSKYGKWAKSLEPFLRKLAKSLILGHFGYKSAKIAKMRFFFENRAVSLFLLFGPLTSCKKAERSNEPFFITFRTHQLLLHYWVLAQLKLRIGHFGLKVKKIDFDWFLTKIWVYLVK